ncbi:MAG: hypothetical protein KIT34_12675 [Cyanobacteria bacterium TGS_CYA1]|nr:hypothetical protein [Cyanobacteria bacterium TGS_CYA1]
MNKSRRNLLKLLAGAPLLLTAGFAGEALMRFTKPSMKAGGIFDPADLPQSATKISFDKALLPVPWTCIPFTYQMKIKVFNPQEEEIRKIPSFLIRLADDEVVAYSRQCPRGKANCLINYNLHPKQRCGCVKENEWCCCTFEVDNPVLMCHCDGSIYDLAREGMVLRGRAPRPPRRYDLRVEGDLISIGLLQCAIA